MLILEYVIITISALFPVVFLQKYSIDKWLWTNVFLHSLFIAFISVCALFGYISKELFLYCFVLYFASFYFSNRSRRIAAIKNALEERMQTIERTYDAIHNGPLQSLACILSLRGSKNVNIETIWDQIERLNREIRSIYEALIHSTYENRSTLCLGKSFSYQVDLEVPLHELLYEVYTYTVRSRFSGELKKLLTLADFSDMNENGLNLNLKADLSRYLEETLVNVLKHAVNPTRLDVLCCYDGTENIIRVQDDGEYIGPGQILREGHGTRSSKRLAKALRGQFTRTVSGGTTRGTFVEMRWPPPRKNLISRVIRRFRRNGRGGAM